MPNIKIKNVNHSSITCISNAFINNYMLDTYPTYALIYIYMQSKLQAGLYTDFDTKLIAEKFNLLESDVVNCLNYWSSQNIIRVSNVDNDMCIEFLDLEAMIQSSIETNIKTEPVTESIVLDTQKEDNIQELKTFHHKPKPNYSIQELETYKTESAEISLLFKTAERALSKLLKLSDLQIIFGFYDWLRLPIDVIEELICYCTSKEHKSLYYMEKVAIDWSENGINTVEKAKEYVGRFSNNYSKILRAVGVIGRVPVKSEIELMNKWIDTYKMPFELILLACERTVTNTGGSSLVYCDTIIKNWYDKNVKTEEDVANADIEFTKQSKDKNDKKPNKKYVNNYNNNPNKIVNYTGRTWDFDKIRELEQQYLEDKVKGM